MKIPNLREWKKQIRPEDYDLARSEMEGRADIMITVANELEEFVKALRAAAASTITMRNMLPKKR